MYTLTQMHSTYVGLDLSTHMQLCVHTIESEMSGGNVL